MKLICSTWGPDYNALPYAVVELDAKQCRRLLDRIRLIAAAHKRDSSLLCHCFFDYSVDYFEAPPDLDEEFQCKLDELDESEWLVLPFSVELGGDVARSEMEILSVYDDEVRWSAVPKHCGDTEKVETAVLTQSRLYQLLGELE